MKPQPRKIKFTRCRQCPDCPYRSGRGVLHTPTTETPDLSDWLDSQEVMQALHISPRTLLTLRNNGTLPYSRIGNKIYYNKQDIQKILADSYVMYKISEYGNK